MAGVNVTFPSRLVLGVILLRRLAKGHFGRRLVLPFSQYVATVDLDRPAKLARLLANLRQGEHLCAAQPDILTLAVALQAKGPRCASTLVDLQKQAVTILVGARIRKSGLDRNRREFAHGIFPHTFFPRFAERECGGKLIFPHTSPTLRSGCRQIASDVRGR